MSILQYYKTRQPNNPAVNALYCRKKNKKHYSSSCGLRWTVAWDLNLLYPFNRLNPCRLLHGLVKICSVNNYNCDRFGADVKRMQIIPASMALNSSPQTPSVFFFILLSPPWTFFRSPRRPRQRLHQRQLHRRLPASERLHRHAGIPPRDLRGFLEDDLGAAHGKHYHDDQAGGEVTGKVEGGRGHNGRIRNSEKEVRLALAHCWWLQKD